MESADYDIKSIHIKGKHNMFADAILRLKTLKIYKEQLENPRVQVVNNMQQVATEVLATSMHMLRIDMLCSDQKWDYMSKEIASQLHLEELHKLWKHPANHLREMRMFQAAKIPQVSSWSTSHGQEPCQSHI